MASHPGTRTWIRRTAPLTGLALATPFNFADVVLGPSIATAMIYGDALYAASLYGRPGGSAGGYA